MLLASWCRPRHSVCRSAQLTLYTANSFAAQVASQVANLLLFMVRATVLVSVAITKNVLLQDCAFLHVAFLANAPAIILAHIAQLML